MEDRWLVSSRERVPQQPYHAIVSPIKVNLTVTMVTNWLHQIAIPTNHLLFGPCLDIIAHNRLIRVLAKTVIVGWCWLNLFPDNQLNEPNEERSSVGLWLCFRGFYSGKCRENLLIHVVHSLIQRRCFFEKEDSRRPRHQALHTAISPRHLIKRHK